MFDMNLLFNILGIIADIITIFSYWSINNGSTLKEKIFFTVALLIVLILFIIASIPHEKIKITNYTSDENTKNVTALIAKHSKKFNTASLVSIYYRIPNSKLSEIVALGVVSDLDQSQAQIDIVLTLDEKKLSHIYASKNNCKEYFVLPYVKYTYLQDLLDIKEV